MTNNVLTLPPYYLTRPVDDGGSLVLYPLAAIHGAGNGDRSPFRSGAEDGPHAVNGWQFEIDDPLTTWWTFAGPWLVADREVYAIRRTRPGERVRDGWIRRDEPRNPNDGPVSPDLIAAHRDAPERPSPDDLDHYREHEAAHVCWPCSAFEATYTARYTQGPPVVEVQQLDGWRELPGGEDPAPDRTWQVTEPGYLTLYGAHTGHLWPGKLLGLREAVVEALRAHPFVAEVSTWSHTSKVSISIRVPFEPRETKTEHVKATPRARTRRKAVTSEVWAISSYYSDALIPDELAAPSKAAALAGWDAAVREQVERFLPFDGDAAPCAHCRGRGTMPRARP